MLSNCSIANVFRRQIVNIISFDGLLADKLFLSIVSGDHSLALLLDHLKRGGHQKITPVGCRSDILSTYS